MQLPCGGSLPAAGQLHDTMHKRHLAASVVLSLSAKSGCILKSKIHSVTLEISWAREAAARLHLSGVRSFEHIGKHTDCNRPLHEYISDRPV